MNGSSTKAQAISLWNTPELFIIHDINTVFLYSHSPGISEWHYHLFSTVCICHKLSRYQTAMLETTGTP